MNIRSKYPNTVGKKADMLEKFFQEELYSMDNSLSEPVSHLTRAGGKRVRPLIFLLLSEGIRRREGVDDLIPAAAGFEAIHTATLIQDDLPSMDDDDSRRDVKAVHKNHGRRSAVLASNILKSKAYNWCMSGKVYQNIENPMSKRDEISSDIDNLVVELCVGQEKDLNFSDKPVEHHKRSEYIDVASKKTASLYKYPAKIAGILFEMQDEQIKSLFNFGRHFGISYQMADDIMDYSLDDRDRYSDIDNERLTIVSSKASEKGIPIFDDSISKSERLDMLKQSGCIEESFYELKNQHSRAISSLENIKISQNDGVIKNIVNYNLRRVENKLSEI